MADEQAPFVDHAAPILAGSPEINDEDRAELWDIFHESKDHNELARRLAPLAIPSALSAQLYDAKKKNAPITEPLDKATEAINRVGQIDPKIMEMAEKYPNVLKALTTAAASATKEAGKPAAAGKSSSKGKTQEADAEASTVAPDVTPVPPGHALVKTSDGALHHIPTMNIEKAKAIDPALVVLHTEP
jgi:hypothetical protein